MAMPQKSIHAIILVRQSLIVYLGIGVAMTKIILPVRDDNKHQKLNNLEKINEKLGRKFCRCSVESPSKPPALL
jgi:hypothetical protein